MGTKNLSNYTPLGLIVFFLVLYLFSRTDEGHDVIYFGLVLILIFLVVSHYNTLLPLLVKGWKPVGQ